MELTREDSIIGDIPIVLIEAYPYISGDDICEFVDSLQSECDSRGIQGIDALSIDYDWNNFPSQSYWNGLIDIQDYCVDNDLPFAMIFWPARSYSPLAPDSDFHTDIMYEANLYFNTYSGSPDIVDVMAWDYTPDQMVPEVKTSFSEYPFTWAFLDFYDTYIDAKDGDVSCSQTQRIPSITSLSPNPSSSDVTIQFHSPNPSSRVQFEAFDLFGRLITDREISSAQAGGNTFTWDTCSNNGEQVPTGVYFVQLTIDGQVSSSSRLLLVNE